jgi:hypothetical protein
MCKLVPERVWMNFDFEIFEPKMVILQKFLSDIKNNISMMNLEIVEIKKCFEESVIELFKFCYNKPNSLFNETDVYGFMFMQLFHRFKKENLFSKDDFLLFGFNRRIKFEWENICKKFSDEEWKTKDIIIDFFKKYGKMFKLEEKMDMWENESVKKCWKEWGVNDKIVFGIVNALRGFRNIDIGIIHPNESLFDEKDMSKHYAIASEIKYFLNFKKTQTLEDVIKDIIKLYMLKLIKICDLAYMIFLDETCIRELETYRKEFFTVKNSKIFFKLDEKMKRLLSDIKMYYWYVPSDISFEELKSKGYEIKEVDNVTIFSVKDLIQL